MYDVREALVIPANIREGDWMQTATGLIRVVTIQRDCPRVENLSARFTMFTCEREDGTIIPLRCPSEAIHGKTTVLKQNPRPIYLKVS